MTVTSTSAAQSYTGTGLVSDFTFTFKVFSSADLYINTWEIATGTLTLLALTTDYTVSLVDGGDGGGTVTLVAGPLPATHKLIIQRLLSYTQETDYVENDPFPAESTEDAIDKLTMLLQQCKEELDRALLGSITTEAGVIAIGYDSGLPKIVAGSANKLIHVNAGATAYELVTVASAITTVVESLTAINTLTEKNPAVDADIIEIEDSADGWNKKKVKLQNLGIGADVEIFISDDTWTKPAGCTLVEVHCVGGGGGGGAGGNTNGAASGYGGSGGGGGSRVIKIFRADDLTATVAVTIGAGGTAGNPGGTTTFGSYLSAYGGGGGITGANAAQSGGGGGGVGGVGQVGQSAADSLGGLPAESVGVNGSGGAGGGGLKTGSLQRCAEYGGGSGGGDPGSGAIGGDGGSSLYGAGGGGCGGTWQAPAGPGRAGGAGGSSGTCVAGGGGAGGSGSGVAGTAGTDGDGYLLCGEGGGGGAADAGGTGGEGGAWGGGGGGGGATVSGAGGAGGVGGDGGCVVYSW